MFLKVQQSKPETQMQQERQQIEDWNGMRLLRKQRRKYRVSQNKELGDIRLEYSEGSWGQSTMTPHMTIWLSFWKMFQMIVITTSAIR